MKTNNKDFLGQGWGYPLSLTGQGEVTLSKFEEDIRQAVLIILGTEHGERVMRPDFGAGMRSLVFEPMNTATLALVKQRVTEALIIWEPRIDNLEVEVVPFPGDGKLEISIDYRVRQTNTFYNLVYPFYLMEGR